jgi:tRNA(fMet)-specific endonuclease VapC
VNRFLDTNICIYYLRGDIPEVKNRFLSTKPGHIMIPSIVQAELLTGAMKSQNRDHNLAAIRSFLAPLTIVPFDNKGAEYYAKIRSDLELQGRGIGPNDIIIAATVLSHGGTLVTNNTGEFKRVPGLKLVNWLEGEKRI